MHTPNASCESVVSCLGSTTVHWSVQLGYKWLSLTVYQQYLYMCIHFTQDTKVKKYTDRKLIHNKTLNFPMITQNINQERCAVSGRFCGYTYMIGFCSFVHDRHVVDSTLTEQ